MSSNADGSGKTDQGGNKMLSRMPLLSTPTVFNNISPDDLLQPPDVETEDSIIEAIEDCLRVAFDRLQINTASE